MISKENGNIITKGSDVGKYNNDTFFTNNACRIVDICVVDYLINGKDVITNLREHMHDPKLFQYILQSGPTYLGTYCNNDIKQQKVSRVFANKTGDTCLFKKRKDGGMVKFPTAPDKMLIWNKDCNDMEDFADKVDISHYYNNILETLERWK